MQSALRQAPAHRAAGCFRPRSRACRPITTYCQAATNLQRPNLQLATARIPASANPERFAESMYQWAATMTQSGANFPFANPLQADRLQSPPGFQISLLKSAKTGGFGSAGDIVGTVEEAAGVGPILMVKFYEGPTAQDGRTTPPPTDTEERLEVVLASLVDVDIIMSTMPNAIRNAVRAASV